MKRILATTCLGVALFGSSLGASAATIHFTDEESPGVSCCSLVSPTAWSSMGIANITNAYWYADGRDLYDQEGLSLFNAGVGQLTLGSVSETVSIDYWAIAGNDITVRVFDASHTLLGMSYLASSSTKDRFGSSTFDGGIKFIEWEGNGGYAQISTLTISAVPEPETYALMLSGLGLLGAVAKRRKA